MPFPALDKREGVKYAVDLQSMGRGQVFFNGMNLGRYWNITGTYSVKQVNSTVPLLDSMFSHHQNSIGSDAPCDYAGEYTFQKCRADMDLPTQRYYHLPSSWIHSDSENILVLWEEMQGGDISSISIVEVTRS